MSSKTAKHHLIKLFGNEDFIEKLKLRENLGLTPLNSKPKGKKRIITYHHISEKSKNGKANVENGALLTRANHDWFHKQSPEMQCKMDDAFQKYKLTAMLISVVKSIKIKSEESIALGDIDSYTKVPLEDDKNIDEIEK